MIENEDNAGYTTYYNEIINVAIAIFPHCIMKQEYPTYVDSVLESAKALVDGAKRMAQSVHNEHSSTKGELR